MKMSLATVRIKKIEPSQLKDSFSATELDRATHIILDVEGLINPPVLQRTGIESYTVIDGDFEYYAALQAMEIERKRNRINAYIVESEEELPFYQQQIAMFRKQSVVTPVEKPIEKTVESEKEPAIPTQTSTVDIQPIMNVIKNLSEQVANLSGQIADIVCQKSKRDAEVDKKFNVLQEAIANISVLEKPMSTEPEKSTVVEQALVTSPSIPKSSDFVADFNNKEISDSEFEMKLNRIGITARFTTPILAERGKRTLNSFADFKIKGVGKETIKKIRNNWS